MGCCQTGPQPAGNAVGGSASGFASNLSDFKDIDAVVAVTQASVNATMMMYLSKAQLHEILKCYAYKPHSKGEIVEVDYKTLVDQAGGSDPFSLTDGADQTDKNVVNLAKVGFVGAFKAKGGLPRMPLANLPPIVTLGNHSDSPVSFNLTSSEFQICGLTYAGFDQAVAINKIQPSGSSAKTAWYYNFLVDLTLNTINPNAPVPNDVRERMKQFIHEFGPNSFSMRKLFLDLETASLVANPVIKGVTDNTDFGPAWAMMSKIFTGAYFSQLRQTGNPIFGYSVTSKVDPTPSSTVAFQSLAYSTAPYLVGGRETHSPASCLAYNLSTRATPPGTQPFTWNWVEANDVSQISGVLSVRRSFIASYLTQQAASPSRWLCFDTSCTTHHDGETFYISTGFHYAAHPARFAALHTPTPVRDGGMKTHTLSFAHKAGDESENSSHTVSIFMDFNYQLDGDIVIRGTQIIITVTAKVAMGFHHHELGVHYTDLPLRDYYYKTKIVTLDLAVSDDGKLTATQHMTVHNNSASWDFHAKGIEGLSGLEGYLKKGLSDAQGGVDRFLKAAFDAFADNLADNFNQYHQWVFPGADTFVMSHVFFSHSCDLVTQLRYATPSMNGLVDEAKQMISPVMQPTPPVVEEVTYDIAASAELMTNYIQSDILQPQKKFQALQTDAGLGLLFMIGTEDFNVVVEESGKTMHGWTLRNLSEKLIKQSFPKGGTVSTFGVSQAAGKGTSREIHVAMCVEAEGTSNLYLSLHNSDVDLSWTKDIPWLHAPFNAVDSSGKPVPVPQPLSIANIMLSQASDGEHIVVDILRNQEAAQPLLERYWIDVSKSQPLWKKHQMAADFEASTYQSTLGRAKGDFVDGIYTMGQVNRVAQLVYAPLYGFDPLVPPPVSRLRLPEDLVPDAIAAARHSNGDDDSDLYVASHGGLYYFAAGNQGNDAVATKVVSEPSLLAGVKKLFAAEEKGVVTVWGLNGSNQVFYLTCKTDEVTDSDAWSVPLPILTSVDAVSPYVDRKFLANTFFAHTGTSLRKYIKTPGTGLWTSKSITLPPTSYKQDSRSIQSFTTELKVTNQTTGMTAANVAVEVTSTTVTSVSINHLYYQVGPQPVTVQTDQDGTITIVELTNSLVATRFHVAIATNMLGLGGPKPLQVNPMDAAFKRNSALNSKDKLRGAKVTDMHGTQKPWIPPDTPDDTLDQIAKLNKNLDEASKDVGNSALPLAPRRLAHTRSTAKLKVSGIDLDLSSARMVDIGDLFNALGCAFKATIKFVKDEISGAWHILAIIEGKIYAALMDTLEAIGGAIQWVYNQIKMAIEWVILFLEFLFGWQDILVTHRVIKKFISLTASEFIDDLASARAATKKALDDFRKNIAEFTGVKPGLRMTGAEALKTPDPSAKQSAPGHLGKHHFKGNVTRASAPKKVDLEGVPSALQSLVKLCESAEESVEGAAQRLRTQVLEEFSHLDLTTVMERIAGIISIALVDGAEGMILELFTACETFVGQLMGMLDHTIDIPVISWLYKLLTGEDLSLLDLACLIAAIPTTVYYKALMGHAPFSTSDACTERMLNAKTVRDWNNAPYDQQPLEGALLSHDPAKRKAAQALALGAGAMAGSVIRLFCTAVRRDMQKDDTFSDGEIKLMESFRWVGSMVASAPALNVNMFDKVPDAKEWYVGMSKVLTAWGKVLGFVQIFYVTNKNEMIGKAFATLSTTGSLLKLIPHVVTPIEENDWSAHIVLKTLGKVSNDCGGILSLPQQLTPSPGKEELFSYECMFRVSYGALMILYPCTWLAGA